MGGALDLGSPAFAIGWPPDHRRGWLSREGTPLKGLPPRQAISKSNFGVLEGFLSELLNEKITICEILESESNRRTRSDKQNRLDLKAGNHKGEFIIIEVQYDFQLDYMHRILYSAARTVTEHLGSGHPYGEVVKVISVSILYFDLGHGEDYVYHGTTGFRGIHCNIT